MNNKFLLLSTSIFFLLISATACSQQAPDNTSNEDVSKQAVSNNMNTESPKVIQQPEEEKELEKPSNNVCDNKAKIDALFFPEHYNEDTAKKILLRPQTYFDQGISIDEEDRLYDRAETVIYRGDLNSDLRIDFISTIPSDSYMGEFPAYVYINCGNNHFVGSLWKEAPGIRGGVKILDNNPSDWKLIQTQNQNASTDPYKQDYGFNITYEYKNGFYSPIKKTKAKILHPYTPLK